MQSTDKKKTNPSYTKDQLQEAAFCQEALRNLTRIKNGQVWLHERALALAEHLDDTAGLDDLVTFWTRENVKQAVDDGDMQLMCHWLRTEIARVEGWLCP